MDAVRTLPEQIADRITEGMGWQGQVRLLGGAMSEQKRVVHDGEGRWVGVTASFAAPRVCSLHAGLITPDGTFAAPAAHSGPVAAEDTDELTATVRQLWAQLDQAAADRPRLDKDAR